MNNPYELDNLATVKIESNGTVAHVYVNGVKVPRLLGFKVEQNAQEKREAEVTLRIQCNLDLNTTMIPKLPEPWATLVESGKIAVPTEKIKNVLLNPKEL